jgi:N-acetylglucosaminyl-diphospho-decaprenol L-rhamnosyltransferase
LAATVNTTRSIPRPAAAAPDRGATAPAAAAPDPRIAVVIVALNAAARIGRALGELTALAEAPRIVVVDNASTDGTAQLVRRRFPGVTVVSLPENRGAAGRNVGVALVEAPYVAFAEDDSWYEPGALRAAADILDAHPDIALVNAGVSVGEDRRPEPLHADMVDTPIAHRRPELPGYRILSFLEGVSVVRRAAFLAAGGFDRRLLTGGAEEHLAADLLAAGWELRYVPAIGARHVPDHRAPSAFVRRLGLRNALWFAWGRRPVGPALRWTLHVLRSSPPNRSTLLGAADALRGLPRVLRERRPLPADVEAEMALLDESKINSRARCYGRPRSPVSREPPARRAGPS